MPFDIHVGCNGGWAKPAAKGLRKTERSSLFA